MKYFKIFLILAALLCSAPSFSDDVQEQESLIVNPSVGAGSNFEVGTLFNDIFRGDIVTNLASDDVSYFDVWQQTIWGTFIFKPWTKDDGSVTVMAAAVGFANVLALMMGVFVLVYALLAGVLHASDSGAVYSRGWSSVWTPFRTVLGVGLIVPAPAVGGGVFSMIQLLTIWATIVGSNAGTVLYKSIVPMIVKNGIYSYNVVDIGKSPVVNLIHALTCEGFSSYKVSGDNDSYVDTSVVTKMRSVANEITSISAEEIVQKDNINEKLYYYFNNGDSGSEETSCGYLTLDPLVKIATTEVGLKENGKSGGYVSTILNGYSKMMNDVADVYMDFVKFIKENETAIKTLSKLELLNAKESDNISEARPLLIEMNGFRNRLVQINKNFSTKVGKDLMVQFKENMQEDQDQTIKEISKGGFAAAGLWYIKIGEEYKVSQSIKPENLITESDISQVKSCTTMSTWDSLKSLFGGTNCEDITKEKDAYLKVSNRLNKYLYSGIDSSEQDNSLNVFKSTSSMEGKCSLSSTNCSPSKEDSDSFVTATVKNILLAANGAYGMTHLNEVGNNLTNNFFISNELPNPFLASYNIGSTIVTAIGTLSNAKVLLRALSAGIKGAGKSGLSVFGAAVITDTAASYLDSASEFIAAIVAALIPIGYVLTFVIPMLPVITWINMQISYLLVTIEAPIAAPIAFMQMLLPEGEGIVGTRLERSMQIIMIITLKPSLMIMGFLASLVLSNLAFGIFNFFFWGAASMKYQYNPIYIIGILILYTTSLIGLASLVVSIMYKLPTTILEWFSANVGNRSLGEEALESRLAQGEGAMAGSFSAMAGKKSDEKSQSKNEKDKKDSDSSSKDGKGSTTK